MNSNLNLNFDKIIFRTKWNSEPYVCGSYSYVDVNCDVKKTFEDLVEPIYYNGVVCLFF